MPKRSGTKGDEFERFVASHLNKVYQVKEFKKTPGSGALVGLSNFGKNRGLQEHTLKTLSSDIITPDWFPYSIECKWYKDSPNYSKLIKDRDSDLDHWLAESLNDGINTNQISLVFFKTNNKGIHLCFPEFILHQLQSKPSHYVKYGEFIIVGLSFFESISNDFKTNSDKFLVDFQHWVSVSSEVKDLIKKL